jgi:SAM-dependent methyltransferase
MKPTERFSDRVDDYRRYRPGYPMAVIDLIRQTCGIKGQATVADLGSGTGVFTKMLLEAGFEVTAVEPNAPMRLAAEEDLRHFDRFHSVATTAEQTGLPSASFDVITVAQAFHWFVAEAAHREFQRLLRPDGWVFIIGNHRQKDTSSFDSDYDELFKTFGDSHDGAVQHRDQAIGARNRVNFFPADSLYIAHFDNPHLMEWPGLCGRFFSSSYAPTRGDPRHEKCLIRLKEIFQKHAVKGQVRLSQKTEVYYGKLSAIPDSNSSWLKEN